MGCHGGGLESVDSKEIEIKNKNKSSLRHTNRATGLSINAISCYRTGIST